MFGAKGAKFTKVRDLKTCSGALIELARVGQSGHQVRSGSSAKGNEFKEQTNLPLDGHAHTVRERRTSKQTGSKQTVVSSCDRFSHLIGARDSCAGGGGGSAPPPPTRVEQIVGR